MSTTRKDLGVIDWLELSEERKIAGLIVEEMLSELQPVIKQKMFDSVMRGVRLGVLAERRRQSKLVSEVMGERK